MAVEAGSDEAIVIVDVTIVRGPRSDRCSVARGNSVALCQLWPSQSICASDDGATVGPKLRSFRETVDRPSRDNR